MAINDVKTGEIRVSFFERPDKLHVKAAFVDKKTGATHGFTTNETWSKRTLAALEALKLEIERDLRKLHFDQDAEDSGEAPGVIIEDLGKWVDDDGKSA